MKKAVIIDYSAGNLRSAANMLAYLGVSYEITSEPEKILKAERIIFPGQGHFGQAVQNLEKKGLKEAVKKACSSGIPFLGICVGMQILFERSGEAPDVNGLGIFRGAVKKFTGNKTPQIGWSLVKPAAANKYIPEAYYYFVNSYYAEPEDKSIVSGLSCYGIKYCSAAQKDNITAVQFHPEKSAEAGIQFFKNWLEA